MDLKKSSRLSEKAMKQALQKVFASKGFKVFIGAKSLQFEGDNEELCWKAKRLSELSLDASLWKSWNLLAHQSWNLLVHPRDRIWEIANANAAEDQTWKSLALKIVEGLGKVMLVEDSYPSWSTSTLELSLPKTIEEILVEGDLL